MDTIVKLSILILSLLISMQDEVQLRHKTMPIPIAVNLCLGDDRKIEVNSGFPLMDVVPTICEEFGELRVQCMHDVHDRTLVSACSNECEFSLLCVICVGIKNHAELSLALMTGDHSSNRMQSEFVCS